VTHPDSVDLDAALSVIARAQPRCGDTTVVAIDGLSGTGKTCLATVLSARIPASCVLHMDDLYAGWDGLRQAVADLHDQILAPLARGERAAYRAWDWEHERYDGWRTLTAANLVIVEGVGSSAGRNGELESALVWLEADRDVRFRRGIERDGDAYLPHWLRWAEQEQALFVDDAARDRADLVINTTAMAHGRQDEPHESATERGTRPERLNP